MSEPYERLQQARRAAKFETPTKAAEAFGWKASTYRSHENGTRGLRSAAATKYGKAFHVPAEWLLFNRGKGTPVEPAPAGPTINLVGYVGAGAEAFFEAGQLGDVEPPITADTTVAVEIRGTSLGKAFDRWIVFYDDVRRPVTSDLTGRLCIVGLSDGRTMIKIPHFSKTKKGLFHLFSNEGDPILDVEIDWAARVKMIAPK